MSDLLTILSSYVPPLVTRSLDIDSTPLTAPEVQHFSAAVLFADITGFTSLAEELTRSDPAGVEKLMGVLNGYFGQLTAHVMSYGGEVVNFAGDALLALWPAADEDLKTVTLRAAQCGLSMQRMVEDYNAVEGVRTLSLRVGISAGDVSTEHLGGVQGHWKFVVVGSPLAQVSIAESAARPGEVLLSPSAWGLIQAESLGRLIEPDENLHRLNGLVQIQRVNTFLRFNPALPPVPVQEIEGALRAYVPSPILSLLSAGNVDWMGELRRVTILFIKVPGLNTARQIDRARRAIAGVQTILYRYEGSLDNLLTNDHGMTIVAEFGLPPQAHANDALRGVQAALAIRSELRQLEIRGTVGVATGRAFCGAIGSEVRREYTVIGDAVNLAARLMQIAAPDDILCDDDTYQAAQAHQAFESMPSISVKGKAEQVLIHRPISEAPKRSNSVWPVPDQFTADQNLIGRLGIRQLLNDQLHALKETNSGGVVIIEGEAGSGKTRIVLELIRQAQQLDLSVAAGSGDAIEVNTAFNAWRGILGRLLEIDILDDPNAQREQASQVLAARPELLRSAAVLNELLPFDFPTDRSAKPDRNQARQIRSAVVSILQLTTASQPRVLILEDAQWLDAASWALVLAVSQQVDNLLLVLVLRTLIDPLPIEFQEIADRSDVLHLHLDAFSLQETHTLLRQRFNVSIIERPVLDLIYDKAGGQPFFTEELAFALRKAGIVEVENDRCRLAAKAGDAPAIGVPVSVQGLMTHLIDQLLPAQQMALKVASVIGRTFAYRTLYDIYPVEADKPRLRDHLAALQRFDIIDCEVPEPALAYRFKTAMFQEVAHSLMLFSQRRKVQQAVAAWRKSHPGKQTQDLR